MSWSVNASGNIADVKAELDRQFAIPLAEAPAGLSDNGERETVWRISELLGQVLQTFGTGKTVKISAYGHMGYDDWATKTGAYQSVALSVEQTVEKTG